MNRESVRPIAALSEFQAHTGETLQALSDRSPILVVFLRHFGCMFAREAMSDLARRRQAIEARGVRLVLIHMGHPDLAAAMLTRYGLGAVPRVSDPERRLYRAFGLVRATLGQVAGPRVWLRSLGAFLAGHRLGRVIGDGLQMSGVFLVHRGRVVRGYSYQSVADRPDYVAMASVMPARVPRPVPLAS
ncbi:MAG: peroxiredoxin-like family protein [Armatimonadota bacterium]|nr:peroxiredoxin-like family protein [Armatimonadota bacterium]